jgi:hypothetical protein
MPFISYRIPYPVFWISAPVKYFFGSEVKPRCTGIAIDEVGVAAGPLRDEGYAIRVFIYDMGL